MTRRSGIMLCYPFEEKRLERWNPPYIVQPKLDGERCRAVYSGEDNRGYILVSSEQNEILSVPHINEALNNLGCSVEFDGELYCHGLSFEQIHSRVGRTVNIHENFSDIEFHIFDTITDEPQYQRLYMLSGMIFSPPLRFVRSEIANSLDEIISCYEQFVGLGYEGIIVRHFEAPYERKRSTWVMKFKPKKDDWYWVVGAVEEVDKNGSPKGSLGALVCRSDDGTTFHVGSGLTKTQRAFYWDHLEELPGQLCHVQYQHSTPGRGVPRFPVFVELQKGGL